MEIRAGNLPRTCDRIDMSRPIRDLLRVDPLAEKKKPATQRLTNELQRASMILAVLLEFGGLRGMIGFGPR